MYSSFLFFKFCFVFTCLLTPCEFMYACICSLIVNMLCTCTLVYLETISADALASNLHKTLNCEIGILRYSKTRDQTKELLEC